APAPERTPVVRHRLEPDELEDVVAALLGPRQLAAPHGELGATRRRAVELDREAPAADAPDALHGRRLAVHEQRAAGFEPLGVVARPLDDEGAVEAVRPPHAADLDQVLVLGAHGARVLLGDLE